MKITIFGYSGAGKSTLARQLGEKYHTEVLHLDQVQFMEGWECRTKEDQLAIVRDFMDTHTSWIIDGNYAYLDFDRRMAEADRIIFMNFGRLNCLWRVWKRWLKYHKTTRPDMAEGCSEKLDLEFILWVLKDGRSKETRDRYDKVVSTCKGKITVLQNQKALDAFLKRRGIES